MGLCRGQPQPLDALGMEVDSLDFEVIKGITEEEIGILGAAGDWSMWECAVSEFPRAYVGTEVCLIVEGDVTITPHDDRPPVTAGPGDLCVLPSGLKCTWKVRSPVKKLYKVR